jgi:hypothetical protein
MDMVAAGQAPDGRGSSNLKIKIGPRCGLEFKSGPTASC